LQVDVDQRLEVIIEEAELPGFDADLFHFSQTCR
jgi:hypothetical protein